MTLRRPAQVLGELVDAKTRRLPHPKLGRVEGRNPDGTTILRFLDGTCEARLGVTGGRKGEVVTAAPSSLGFRGTAGIAFAPSTATATGGDLWLERLEPDVFEPGQDVTVHVVGRGFRPSTRFDFLRAPGSLEIHAFIEILETRFIDSETVEMDLRINDNAPVIERAPVAFG